jgi:dTDP-4-dehydrorhamnose reductase
VKQNGTIKGYKNVLWNGVSTLTLAKGIDKAIKNDITGIYHLVNDSGITKYELLKMFNKYFNKKLNITEDSDIISNKTLINTRADFDFIVPSYEDMVMELKKWMDEHVDLYN